MADLKELDKQIESTQVDLQAALTRLQGFAELQSTLQVANAGLHDGGEALSKLSEHLALTTQSLTSTLGEFSNAIDAMRKATPEALSHNVDLAVSATQRTEQHTREFQSQLKEEIAEQRESLERRVHAVEGGLEQTRATIAQLRHRVDERADELNARVTSSGRWTFVGVCLTLLIVLASTAYQFYPRLMALIAG
ncbi:MAG: hypothetical protein K0U93_01430 [Gammaproteobacteria bacterium]|nr:hypothetical protein [Gammaproteobacteria bacterium]